VKTLKALGRFMLVAAILGTAMTSVAGCLTSEQGARTGNQPAGDQGGAPAQSERPLLGGYPGKRLPTERPAAGGYPGGGEGTAVPEGAASAGTAGTGQAAATAPVPAACGAVQPGFQPYFDTRGGYCLQIPDGFIATVAKADLGRQIVTFARAAEVTSPTLSGATLAIEVLGPSEDGGASDLAKRALAGYLGDAGSDMVFTDAQIGGEAAAIVDGVPGMAVMRQAYLLHGGLGYSISVTPWNDPAHPSTQGDADGLWQAVLASLIFVDVD
jgi:hypothetical protein